MPSVPTEMTFSTIPLHNTPQTPLIPLTNHNYSSNIAGYGAESGAMSPYTSGGFTSESALAWSVRGDGSSISGSVPFITSAHTTRSLPRTGHGGCYLPNIPLPSHAGDVVLHPALRSPPDTMSYPRIDLSSAHRFVSRSIRDRDVNSQYLCDPATDPELPSLSIIHPMLPWAITVHRTNLQWVTVADVLATIGSALLIPLDRLSRYEVRRHNPSADERILEREGAIRLDLLGSRHRFAGLSRSSTGDTWELNTRR
ncbi:Mitogen-Activated Protein Kinase Kinase Kinase 8 [Paramarasmius palmivorus]|uniref:Mitogen-Activated Protein Kinase Kinase Kinase 8 n=1 Tax=Paramarasmius palmivorus TaxID=297713 RepID=A0AAW0CP46_9AGAR